MTRPGWTALAIRFCWPNLEDQLKNISDLKPAEAPKKRSTESMIEEILELVRGLVRDQTPKMVLEVLRGNWDELLDEK